MGYCKGRGVIHTALEPRGSEVGVENEVNVVHIVMQIELSVENLVSGYLTAFCRI